MQNLSKKMWAPNIPLKSGIDVAIEWCIRAREKNIIRKLGSKVYYSYVLDDTPPLIYLQNISQIFKYSQKDIPYVDLARDKILRLLSVCFKAHYFLFDKANIAHEPYFFVIPNLEIPSQTNFGVVYKLENTSKCILCLEQDISCLFENYQPKHSFNVVVSDDSFKWYSVKLWSKYKNDNIHNELSEKPWLLKKLHSKALEATTAEELSNYATILDVPYEIKDYIKPLGIEWSKNLKTWFLPKGFDLDSVEEYILFLKKEKNERK